MTPALTPAIVEYLRLRITEGLERAEKQLFFADDLGVTRLERTI